MSEYKGKTVAVGRTGAEIADKFANLRNFQPTIDALPAEAKDKLKGLELDEDSVAFDVNMVGRVKFRIIERTPERVLLTAEGTPMPFTLRLDMKPDGDASTLVTPVADLDIPFMLRGMVGPYVQKAMDQIGGFITTLAGA